MSQEINNREYRQKVLKELISQLHVGKSVDEVKQRFEQTFEGVSAAEIAEAEQALIAEGLPVTEVQRLCDVHAAVFKGSIQDIHQTPEQWQTPGHPGHTLQQENRALEALMENDIRLHLNALLTDNSASSLADLTRDFALLSNIHAHFVKKENLMFPYLEKYGITAPPKVMWGVDDEIRGLVKTAAKMLAEYDGDGQTLKQHIDMTLQKITEMIFKEENILLPMLMETLTPEEWKSIAEESDELGYCLIPPPPGWDPADDRKDGAEPPREATAPGTITLPTGSLRVEELTRLLDTLPIDITFVDKDDHVKYFSQAAERIFPRTKAIIGRNVANCHPPASVHIVEGIVKDFKSGKKEHEDFWIKMGEKYILIRYFAVRDDSGAYMGTLEVTQNIAPIQEISGEKRLVSE